MVQLLHKLGQMAQLLHKFGRLCNICTIFAKTVWHFFGRDITPWELRQLTVQGETLWSGLLVLRNDEMWMLSSNTVVYQASGGPKSKLFLALSQKVSGLSRFCAALLQRGKEVLRFKPLKEPIIILGRPWGVFLGIWGSGFKPQHLKATSDTG